MHSLNMGFSELQKLLWTVFTLYWFNTQGFSKYPAQPWFNISRSHTTALHLF